MTDHQTLTFAVLGTGQTVRVSQPRVVVAGYTGADPDAVQHHIDELATIGIPPPPTVPAFYPMPAELATQEETIAVSGARSSGEVEPVLIRIGGQLFLAVGSDHTDRELERDSVARSKEVCAKPISRTVLELPDAALDWSGIVIRSTVDGQQYQKGSLGSLRPPTEVLASCTREVSRADGDIIMFGGTVPLMTGNFVPGREWTVTLEVPGLGELTHHYMVRRAEPEQN